MIEYLNYEHRSKNAMLVPKTLIVVPTAKGSATPEWMYAFDKGYDILHVDYTDNPIPPHTTNREYMVLNYKGQKWAIVKQLLNNHMDLLKQYQYIGFWDDDLEANHIEIARSIIIADACGAEMWQMSVTEDSDCSYEILKQRNDIVLATTSFIEIMAPFFHHALLEDMRDLFNQYEVSTGWGFDIIAPYILRTDPLVIHSYAFRHPFRKNGSLYNKTAAVEESRVCLRLINNSYYNPVQVINEF